MPNINRILLTLIFFALLLQRANTPNSRGKNSQETNLELAKKFLWPTCPMKPINKPAHSMMLYNTTISQFYFVANPKFKEIFEHSPEAIKRRIDTITNLRVQAALAGNALKAKFLNSEPYKNLSANLAKNSKVKQQALDHLYFLITTHTFANIAQRAQAGNCHEFSSVTLAQTHRYSFERKLPMPRVGSLHFFNHHNLDIDHEVPVFGVKPKANNVTFNHEALVKFLTKMNAVVADHWNKGAIVLAHDICQTNTSTVYSPDLNAMEKHAAPAKAFYNSFCDAIRYETFPPLPSFSEPKHQIAFEACIQYILDATNITTCQLDKTLLSAITPKP